MVQLYDLVDEQRLEELIASGYISRKFHPEYNLGILNYTNKTTFDHMWVHETNICRGLIYDTHTQEVVARPFYKFWEYRAEETGPTIALDSPVVVTDKLDGSLGVIYPTPGGGFAAATRGSFISDQAIKATQLLTELCVAGKFNPEPGFTYLVEILYPQNRVVVDYGQLTSLFLLAKVNTETGEIWPATQDYVSSTEWGHFRTNIMPYKTLAEALAAEQRPGAEGFVIQDMSTGVMLKLKQDDYKALHKIVFGLNTRGIWELLSSGKGVDELLNSLPVSFHPWVREKAEELEDQFYDIWNEVSFAFAKYYLADLDRKSLALSMQGQSWDSIRPLVFGFYDKKDISKGIWKQIRPKNPEKIVGGDSD